MDMKNTWVVLILIILLGVGYYFILKNKPVVPSIKVTTPTSIPTTVVEPLILGPFKGKLPCADCTGLETVITFTRSATGSAEGTFEMSEDYLGKSVEPIKTTGNWTTLRGTKKDPNAVVYQLNPDKPEESQYYLKVNENQIKMLDKGQNEISGPFNYTLAK